MLYILLSVLLNASLFIIFKLFDKFKINTIQAIVINYYVAFGVAYYASDVNFSITKTPYEDWFLGTVFLGFLFITLFYVMGLTAQKLGMSVVAVASKMSVVIPVLVGIIIYKESIGIYKIIGILLALIAVYYTSHKENKALNKAYFYLPLVLFFGSGVLDTTLNYIQTTYVAANETSVYLSTIFLVAGILGSVFLLLFFLAKKTALDFKSVIAGIVLGIPNYFAMYFLLKALQTDLDSSTIFTVNNVAIVLFSAVLGLLLFKEQLSKKNIIGIGLAIISIILITLSI